MDSNSSKVLDVYRNVPGKVYGRVFTERVMEVPEGKVSKEQGEFRKGKDCADQIFAI